MTTVKARVYFDTCCFVDLAQMELGIKPDGPPSHIDACRIFLKAARAGDVRIFTSLITMTEFVCVKGHPLSATNSQRERVLDDAVKTSIRRLLLAGSPVVPVQPSLRITEDARDLCWEHGMALKSGGADRIHLASARFVQCDYFVTTDQEMRDHEALLLKALSLRVVTCDEIKDVIPDSYFPRQKEIFDAIKQSKSSESPPPTKRVADVATGAVAPVNGSGVKENAVDTASAPAM